MDIGVGFVVPDVGDVGVQCDVDSPDHTSCGERCEAGIHRHVVTARELRRRDAPTGVQTGVARRHTLLAPVLFCGQVVQYPSGPVKDIVRAVGHRPKGPALVRGQQSPSTVVADSYLVDVRRGVQDVDVPIGGRTRQGRNERDHAALKQRRDP